MSISQLLNRLPHLPGLKLGHGPKHPLTPEPNYADYLREHLENFPFLNQHHDFIVFLEIYAGAEFMVDETPDLPWCVGHLFGIEDTSPPVNPQGFYEFAIIGTASDNDRSVKQMQSVFAFDAGGNRQNAVYAAVGPVDDYDWNDASYRVYCDTFAEWLQRLIEADGRLMPASAELEPALAHVGSSESA